MARAFPLLSIALFMLAGTAGAHGQDLPRGAIVDEVKCGADPGHGYALYVPSAYSTGRQWPVLMAFHPGARGRVMVEKYRAAAEQYGYIVAGSNTSRNGPWEVSAAAVKAMSIDLGQRFAIDPQRIYLTGLSGGARVAMQVALSNKTIAGVIASSGGYPDSQPRSRVGFAVFSTAGLDDFNYIEMRLLDRKLSSPHAIAIFDGGHTLPPDDIALDAIEWLELQAMKTGRRVRDEALLAGLVDKRHRQIAAATSDAEVLQKLQALVADFGGLRDVSVEQRRAADLARQPEVRKALARQRAADDAEARMLAEVLELEAALADDARRTVALMTLRDRFSRLSARAAAGDGPGDARQARRLLRGIAAGAAARVQDRDYLALVQQYAPRGR